MKVDGRAIADLILESLKPKVFALKKKGVTPTMAVMLVGDDHASLSYISQKQMAAQKIGAALALTHLPTTTSVETLALEIARINADPTIHGLIVQRPVPLPDIETILEHVKPAKDIDGFIDHSPFEVPVAKAVLTILSHIHDHLLQTKLVATDFLPWLTEQAIVVVGRGQTAGLPIAIMLQKHQCAVSVVHSQTSQASHILKHATIIVSCVGKARIITKSNIQRGVILIGVGLFRGDDNTLHGDYEVEEIQDIASFYTPTTGGVGPVNVASLMQNLIDACILQRGRNL